PRNGSCVGFAATSLLFARHWLDLRSQRFGPGVEDAYPACEVAGVPYYPVGLIVDPNESPNDNWTQVVSPSVPSGYDWHPGDCMPPSATNLFGEIRANFSYQCS